MLPSVEKSLHVVLNPVSQGPVARRRGKNAMDKLRIPIISQPGTSSGVTYNYRYPSEIDEASDEYNENMQWYTLQDFQASYDHLNPGVPKNAKPKKTWQALGKCMNNCQKHIDLNLQKTLYETYSSLNTRPDRMSYLLDLIHIVTPDELDDYYQPNNIRTTFIYTVPKDGSKIQVCKKCFRTIFSESNKFLYNVCTRKKDMQ